MVLDGVVVSVLVPTQGNAKWMACCSRRLAAPYLDTDVPSAHLPSSRRRCA